MNRATFDAAIAELRALAADRAPHARYLEGLLAWEEAGGLGDGPDPEGRPGLSTKAADALEGDVLGLYGKLRHPDAFVSYGRDYPRLRANGKLAAARAQATRDAGGLASLLRLDRR